MPRAAINVACVRPSFRFSFRFVRPFVVARCAAAQHSSPPAAAGAHDCTGGAGVAKATLARRGLLSRTLAPSCARPVAPRRGQPTRARHTGPGKAIQSPHTPPPTRFYSCIVQDDVQRPKGLHPVVYCINTRRRPEKTAQSRNRQQLTRRRACAWTRRNLACSRLQAAGSPRARGRRRGRT